jgi:hypothetical protein
MTVTNDMSRFAAKVTKTFGRMQTKRTYKYIAGVAIELIQEHVRKGYGLTKHGAPLKRLKGLSKNYKKWRSGKGRKLLGKHAKPNFSNLNLTGEMIDSLGVLTLRKDRVTIGPSKTKHSRSKLTNWKIANLHHKGAGSLPKRKFNYLSKNEVEEVVKAFSDALTKELKNARLSRRR